MALEGEGGQSSPSSSGRTGGAGGGDGDGSQDGTGDTERGLSDTIKELFAGRLMNYIEVRS